MTDNQITKTKGSLLKEGIVKYKSKEANASLTITGGVVEVLKNKVVLLADGVVA